MPLTFAEIVGKPSMQDLMARVQDAVNHTLNEAGPGVGGCSVCEITETDAIVNVGGETYRYPYTLGADGAVELGEPVEVTLSWRDAPDADDAVEMRETGAASLAFLTDLQNQQFAEDAGGVVQIEVCRDGTWKHPSYGEVKVDAGLRRRFVENFHADVLKTGELPLDYDHERGPAPGWITGLHCVEDRLLADVRWTPAGRQKVQDGEYRLFSPEWVPNFVDAETGAEYGPTLKGGAITNKPFFRGMTALTYSEPAAARPRGGVEESGRAPGRLHRPAADAQQFGELQAELTHTRAELAALRTERQRDQLTRQFSGARFGDGLRLRLTPVSVERLVDAALSKDPGQMAEAAASQQFVELGERGNLLEDGESSRGDFLTAQEEASLKATAERSGLKFEELRDNFVEVKRRRGG